MIHPSEIICFPRRADSFLEKKQQLKCDLPVVNLPAPQLTDHRFIGDDLPMSNGFGRFIDRHPLVTIATVAVTAFVLGSGAATWILMNGYVPNQLYSLTKELEKYKNLPARSVDAPAAFQESPAPKAVEPAQEAKVSEQAMNAQRFVLKYDGLSEAERKQFLKNHDGETVNWDLVVLNSGHDNNGKVLVFCRASIKEQWRLNEAHPCFVTANPASEALGLNLRQGDLIQVNGVLNSSESGIAMTADLKLIGHCEACQYWCS